MGQQLQAYINETRRLLRDSLGLLTTNTDLTAYINEARGEVAKVTGCLEVLVSGMSPYGNSAQPGVMVPGGFTPGSQLTSTFQTIVGQEKYPYSFAAQYAAQSNAGIQSVYDVTSIAVSWGSMRPALNYLPWEDFQAYCRSYSYLVTSYPTMWSNDGDGENANVWMFPVPCQALEMEWQVLCSPTPIYTNSDYDSIPAPWVRSVKFYAAYLAFLGRQQMQQAELNLNLFNRSTVVGRGATDHGRVTNWYGW